MAALTVRLDSIPPSLNNLYATVGNRRVLRSSANDWKRAAAWQMKAAATAQGWSAERKVPLFVEVLYSAPDVLRWDIDGKPKLLLDALCEAFGLDDRYVMSLEQTKVRGPAWVEVRVMTGEVEL